MASLTQTFNFTSLLSTSVIQLGKNINDALQSITDAGRNQIEIQDIDIFIRKKTSRSPGVYNVNIMYRTPGNSEYFAQGLSVPIGEHGTVIGGNLDEFGWLTAAGMLDPSEQPFPIRVKQVSTSFVRHTTYQQMIVLWKKQDAWTDTSDTNRKLMVVIAQEDIAPGALGTCTYKYNENESVKTREVRNVSNITLLTGGAAWAYMDIEDMELVLIPSCCN